MDFLRLFQLCNLVWPEALLWSDRQGCMIFYTLLKQNQETHGIYRNDKQESLDILGKKKHWR